VKDRRSFIRRAAAVASCATVLGAGSLVAASSAMAATTTPAGPARADLLCKTQFVANGVRIHVSDSLSSTVLGLGYDGQWFYAQSFVTGSGGVDFLYGTDESTGVTGYVDSSSSYLNINECP
jgi:hypothetical protein